MALHLAADFRSDAVELKFCLDTFRCEVGSEVAGKADNSRTMTAVSGWRPGVRADDVTGIRAERSREGAVSDSAANLARGGRFMSVTGARSDLSTHPRRECDMPA